MKPITGEFLLPQLHKFSTNMFGSNEAFRIEFYVESMKRDGFCRTKATVEFLDFRESVICCQ